MFTIFNIFDHYLKEFAIKGPMQITLRFTDVTAPFCEPLDFDKYTYTPFTRSSKHRAGSFT